MMLSGASNGIRSRRSRRAGDRRCTGRPCEPVTGTSTLGLRFHPADLHVVRLFHVFVFDRCVCTGILAHVLFPFVVTFCTGMRLTRCFGDRLVHGDGYSRPPPLARLAAPGPHLLGHDFILIAGDMTGTCMQSPAAESWWFAEFAGRRRWDIDPLESRSRRELVAGCSESGVVCEDLAGDIVGCHAARDQSDAISRRAGRSAWNPRSPLDSTSCVR